MISCITSLVNLLYFSFLFLIKIIIVSACFCIFLFFSQNILFLYPPPSWDFSLEINVYLVVHCVQIRFSITGTLKCWIWFVHIKFINHFFTKNGILLNIKHSFLAYWCLLRSLCERDLPIFWPEIKISLSDVMLNISTDVWCFTYLFYLIFFKAKC